IERDDSIRVVFIPDEDHGARNLDDPERWNDRIEPRNARDQAPVLGVDVLRPGGMFVVRLLPLLPRGGPRLIRKQAVGRIDDATRSPDFLARDTAIEIFATADRIGQRRRPAIDRSPDALNIRLAV